VSVVVSLTAAGDALARRLLALEPQLRHLHRPAPFAERVQGLFAAGEGLILICATGIAVRVLAPVLRSKLDDPPVLVLDEQGRFVIPLLSGHEGGANEWARQLAERLGAQCVITSAAAYTHPVWVAGLGCERGCPAELMHELLERTLAAHGVELGALGALASIDLKRDEPGMRTLAERLGRPLAFYPAEALRAVEHRLTQRSEHVFRATGCYGVAEAAALVHAAALAGADAELVVPKQKNTRATVALARAYRSPDHA
jgi:cobalt-precorrin 5A hydrolase